MLCLRSLTSRTFSTKGLRITVRVSHINTIIDKIITGFVFLKTYIFVAHGKILSLYDVLKQKWMKHMMFEEEILQVFRQKYEDDYDVCVLLADCKIKVI